MDRKLENFSNSGEESMKAAFFILIFCFLSVHLFSQQERALVRKGNQKYIEGKLDEAETEYNKALDIKNNLTEGVYNLGGVAYQKQDYETAVRQFETAAMLAKDDKVKAKAYHNIGNTYFDAGQYDKSIEAYKNALRLNPSDMDTKYNLAYAQQMLKNNPPQEQQQQQDKDQDKKDDQQDQQDQQEQQANQDKQEGEQQEQQQSQEQQANEEEAQQQQAEQREGHLSKEEAKRLLEALMQEEQKVQQQIVNKKLPPAEKRKIDKDW